MVSGRVRATSSARVEDSTDDVARAPSPADDRRPGHRLEAVSLGALLALTVVAVLWFLVAEDSFDARANETGPIEYGTALFFLSAAVTFGIAAWRGKATRWYAWILAGACFLVAGEELSWGQHILHFGSPEALRKNNVQNEFNFHNLEGIHQSIRAVGIVALVGVFVVLPLAYRSWPSARRACDRLHIPVFPIWPAAWWAVGALFMLVPRLLGGPEWALDELGELYVAVAFFLYGLVTFLGRSEPDARKAVGSAGARSGPSEPPHAADDRVPLVRVDQVGPQRDAREHRRADGQRED